LVASLERVASEWEDYQYTGRTTKRGKSETFKFYFKRPTLVRMDTGRGEVAVQPNGDIRGRRGRGLFGGISRRLDPDDRRLKDDEGIPFYECHFAAIVERIGSQLKRGATAAMDVEPAAYRLVVRLADTVWTYTVDKERLFPLSCRRTVNGKEVEATECSDFRCNMGLKTDLFRF
jgi:hypothetical protein